MDQQLSQFKKTFVKAIELEMEALKRKLGSFEVQVTCDHAIKKSAENNKSLFQFGIKTATDKLSAGMQCNLRYRNKDHAVEIFSVDREKCELYTDINLRISNDDEAAIIVYPWFLYEKLIAGINSLDQITPGLELAFTAFGKSKPVVQKDTTPVTADLKEIFNALNESQKNAVQFSLGSPLSFIWGPPGTGKTHTLSILLGLLLQKGFKVLTVSTTNGAIDTVISKLAELNVCDNYFNEGKIIRFGREHTDEQRVNISYVLGKLNSIIQKEIDELAEAADSLKDDLSDITKIRNELNRSDKQLDLFAQEPAQTTPEVLSRIDPESYDSWTDLDDSRKHSKITELLDKNNSLLDYLNKKIQKRKSRIIKNPRAALDQANVVFSTIAGLYSGDMLSDMKFDVVVIEEAGMAVLPALFYSIARTGKKAVLVGDPMQLPPIVYSDKDYVADAMGRSIYEAGLDEGFSGDHVHLLNTQYRMHPEIGKMVSSLFYNDRLENGVKAEEREHISELPPFPGKAAVLHDFMNKSSCMRAEGSYSRYNELSAEACVGFLNDIPAGFSIGIITPYVAQTNLIKKYINNSGLRKMDIECTTVHRFQGRERDIIILDLTDAKPLSPGILTNGKDAANLLNVAVSRARGKLIVIAEREFFLKNAGTSKVSEMLKYICNVMSAINK